MSDDIYEIYAINYARLDKRRTENFLGGDPHDGPMPLQYYVWVVANAERTIIVDTGLDQRGAELRGRTITSPVVDGLKALDIDPMKIDDVVITHMHYDHSGNNDLFPNARFHLQDTEMAYSTGRCMCHDLLQHPYEMEDVLAMVRRVYDKRVEFYDGDDQLYPGITLHLVGGHARGLQIVRVKTKRGYVMLASDASHFYEHIGSNRSFTVVENVSALLEGYKTVRRLADSPRHIIPGHDPLVGSIYPAAKPGMENWIMRLDIDPTSSPL
ncbi:MAG: N-acyl homoserine lactonase family protein [Rhizobiaceae bacterium]|nr:N-acyl homoserine lactonase family protein [Rhizobiaceae bacterium]